MKSMLFVIVGAVSLLMPASVSRAQGLPSEDPLVTHYARTGYPTIDVYLWGSVSKRGIWRIEPDIDLIELLSVAQVTGIGINEPDMSQKTILSIYREEGGQRSLVYSEQLERMLDQARGYPALQDGDIIELVTTRRRRLGLPLLAQFIGTASSITLLILRLTGTGGR